MFNVDALMNSSPNIMRAGPDLFGKWIVDVEYDLPRENEGDIPCTVVVSLTMPEVHEWCKRLNVYAKQKDFRNVKHANF